VLEESNGLRFDELVDHVA
jgi:hypothetical protein